LSDDTAAVVEKFEDYLLLNGKTFPVVVRDVPQADLNFYLDNPRLYSVVRSGGKEPTEEEILDVLQNMDHVKRLAQSIKDHGGLIDPVIVQAGKNIVLEGNSRLAAYRLLAEKDAVKWGKIRARILPASIDEGDIFALLGEYHIHGKKDWVPFEQAGYLYRRHTKQEVKVGTLAKEIKLSESRVSHLIDVYAFMVKHKQNAPDRWSYFDEYFKGRKVDELRKSYGEDFDKAIVKKVETKEIPTAMALRDGLKVICRVSRTAHKFAEGKITFDKALDEAKDKGAKETSVQRVQKFRTWLAEKETLDEILDLKPELRKKVQYDIKNLGRRCDQILKRLETAK